MPLPLSPTLPSGPPSWAQAADCPRMERFLLGPELGRGGMGRVLDAWDPLLRRRVALKLLHTQGGEQVVRFLREAQSQARLEHPNICRILEIGTDPEHAFIAMPLIQGTPLGDLRPQLEHEDVARIMADVAGAIHTAHRSNLVHRDLKPQNILVEAMPDGGWKPVVVDFGLARDLTLGDQTLSWAFVGTPAFMSPEQVRGEPPTPAVDIYSLGATLYAMLSGGPPFEAATIPGLALQQAMRDPRSLCKVNFSIPQDLETITLKCLEAEPDRRYATAFELESDLRRFLAGEPIHARPLRLPGRVWKHFKRHRTLSLTVAAALVAVMGLVGWNIRTAQLGQRRTEIAQRFGLEVREMESLLRIERMLPPHDIRPAEARMRQCMENIRSQMKALGKVAGGPGHYALGRGLLTLREFEGAKQELQQAWNAGFRAPEVAYALGSVHAELYQDAFGQIRKQRLRGEEERHAVQAAQTQWGQAALAYFIQSHGLALDHPALGEAQVAFIKEDYLGCIAKCQEAFSAMPWLVEAKSLEAEAWWHLTSISDRTGDLEMVKSRTAKSDEALNTALSVAPSDSRLIGQAITTMTNLATQQSALGQASIAPFQRADAYFDKALKIRPGDLDILNCLGSLRMRQAIFEISRGEDPRAMLQETIRRLEPVLPMDPLKRGSLKTLRWILGAAQWYRGEDPRKAMSESRLACERADADTAELSILEGRFFAARGQDPSAAFRAAASDAQAMVDRLARDYYGLELLGEAHSGSAQWALSVGQDPSSSIASGIAALNQSHEQNAALAYSWWDLADIQWVAAQWALARGRDPMPALRESLRAAQKGAAIRPDHFRSCLALAHAHGAEAQLRVARGENPGPALAEARAALAKGFSLNKTNFMLHLFTAQLDLLAAGQGEARAAARAQSSALKGLATKRDSIELWIALARAHYLEAGKGKGRDTHLHQARVALQHAKNLSTDYPPLKTLDREMNAARLAREVAPKDPPGLGVEAD